LDEIGDAPPGLQAKLLRVLQNAEVKAVGSDRSMPVTARIIAATNRRLEDEVAAGRFRSDLYYRLAVFPIRIPPLRERPEDVIPLARHFLGVFERDECRTTAGFAPDTLDLLIRYPWPGNVRELEHEVHRLVLTANAGHRIHPQHLAPRIRTAVPPPPEEPLVDILRRIEAAVIRERLHHLPTKAAAARSLGITREALYWKMRRLGVVSPRGEPSATG
jgi:transcriptional regulator with GAF, ATPase, and Fis domain